MGSVCAGRSKGSGIDDGKAYDVAASSDGEESATGTDEDCENDVWSSYAWQICESNRFPTIKSFNHPQDIIKDL